MRLARGRFGEAGAATRYKAGARARPRARGRTGAMPFILSQFLEAYRWLGALLVLAVHTTNLFVNHADIMSAPHAPLVYVWWFYVGLRAWPSGGARLFRDVRLSRRRRGARQHPQGTRIFCANISSIASSRIYLVVGPAVALTLFVDSLRPVAVLPSTDVYELPLFTGHFCAGSVSWQVFSICRGSPSTYFGTNGPLWSLACEFWYYITFPLLLLPFARNYPAGAPLLAVSRSARRSFWRFRRRRVVSLRLSCSGSSARSRALPVRPMIRSRWRALRSTTRRRRRVIRLVVRGPSSRRASLAADAADLLASRLFVNVLLTFRYGPAEGCFAAASASSTRPRRIFPSRSTASTCRS